MVGSMGEGAEVEQRLDYARIAPDGMQGLGQLGAHIRSVLDPELRELVNLCASQINGCAYCIALHINAAHKLGMREDRLHLLPAWRETTLYTECERAALALTEAVTRISDGPIPDALYAEARRHFSEEEIVALVMLIGLINTYNRIAITFRTTPPAIVRG
jgi:AhpD family alkylhydroperoxidase